MTHTKDFFGLLGSFLTLLPSLHEVQQTITVFLLQITCNIQFSYYISHVICQIQRTKKNAAQIIRLIDLL